LRMGARRFVAGATIREAVETVKRLNEQGKLATLDHLGEFVGDEKEAAIAADMCLQTLDAIAEAGVQSNLSLKLTSLGLDVSPELCRHHMRLILNRAASLGNFVRIDMEDYAHCQPALDLYKELRQEYGNVGIVIQAYLRRSGQDICELGEASASNLRLVKGAYKESEQVAYPQKSEVDKQFVMLIREQLKYGYAAIATHDREVIKASAAWIKANDIHQDRFEFQMLYGISEDLQDQLTKEGFRVRIYVPYGGDWFGYFMRRLAERPANVWFVLKNMWK
ncbi:proline dehydrogenase family protein, partial [Paenibacillus sepulcri]|nr:proline dehydrogenase family protein [Paenibacillus sepulcri]